MTMGRRLKKDNSPSILLSKDEPSLQRREIITGRDACPTWNERMIGEWRSSSKLDPTGY
jgi:hypothetical protein